MWVLRVEINDTREHRGKGWALQLWQALCVILYHNCFKQWLKQPVRSSANIVRRKKNLDHRRFFFFIFATKGENWERKDLRLKDLRNTRKWTNNIKRCIKKAKENWIGEQCSEIEENLRKNNSKRAYRLVKDLTTVKQGKATTVQDRLGKCLTEEWQILNWWTEYCSELYTYKANGDPSVLNCPQTDAGHDHPVAKKWRLQYNQWRKGSQLESTMSQQNRSKQVERT